MEPEGLLRFADRVLLALEAAGRDDPGSGICGVEVELNLLDGDLRPVGRVGHGPESRTFADYLLGERIPHWARDRFQLEVFAWMAEGATRPYRDPRAAVAEARLLELVVHRALEEAELAFGRRLLALHGNLPMPAPAGPGVIPVGWNLARQRYLRRCVELYGTRLATAGIHTNHSFPEPLLAWDYLHLPEAERRRRSLEAWRNDVVIRATRLLRPWCALFVAVSAASPLDWEEVEGEPVVVLTGHHSRRSLTFPNPPELDVPDLYASHQRYLEISYELVRSGLRFGANNWTPVRARSGVEPVMRNILATSEQLQELYRRGLYANGDASLEQAERAVMVENLCARVDLPMNRVEVRTDEAGEDLDLAVAKVVFKQLLMLSDYACPEEHAGFAYSRRDIERCRRNEAAAARDGLEARIEDPFGGGELVLREWLGEALRRLEPLARALGWNEHLEPLRRMAGGGPNPSEAWRAWFLERLDTTRRTPSGAVVVPPELVVAWVQRRREELEAEARHLAATMEGHPEEEKLGPLPGELVRGGEPGDGLEAVVKTGGDVSVLNVLPERCRDVVDLAVRLIRIPSVTNCPEERVDEVFRCARFIGSWLKEAGLEVRLWDDGAYPAVMGWFPGAGPAAVTLCGHFDVVKPEPDDGQFQPRIDGDWLWGRGAADMKTVVASYMVWMRDLHRRGQAPPVNLLLVGNEENGEADPWGTPHVLADLRRREGWEPAFMIVGERTGEEGQELVGKVCTASRGIARLKVTARGRKGHTGTKGSPRDLLDLLVEARKALEVVFTRRLTLSSTDGWQTSARFPFLNVGEPGVYNITAGEGVLGVEIRPIPDDDVAAVVEEARSVCHDLGLEVRVEVMEPGVVCPPDDPWLARLLGAVEAATGSPAPLGRKLPGSSARFAPGGRQVVWGQSGIGPHSAEERHYLPSIEPYLAILDELARAATADPGG